MYQFEKRYHGDKWIEKASKTVNESGNNVLCKKDKHHISMFLVYRKHFARNILQG